MGMQPLPTDLSDWARVVLSPTSPQAGQYPRRWFGMKNCLNRQNGDELGQMFEFRNLNWSIWGENQVVGLGREYKLRRTTRRGTCVCWEGCPACTALATLVLSLLSPLSGSRLAQKGRVIICCVENGRGEVRRHSSTVAW